MNTDTAISRKPNHLPFVGNPDFAWVHRRLTTEDLAWYKRQVKFAVVLLQNDIANLGLLGTEFEPTKPDPYMLSLGTPAAFAFYIGRIHSARIDAHFTKYPDVLKALVMGVDIPAPLESLPPSWRRERGIESGIAFDSTP